MKSNSAFNMNDGKFFLKVSKFDGRETIWKNNFNDRQNVEIAFSFTLTKGKAKIVHIDAMDNVTTIIECTPETSIYEYITKTISMPSGVNRLKIVGFGCENIDFEMFFSKS